MFWRDGAVRATCILRLHVGCNPEALSCIAAGMNSPTTNNISITEPPLRDRPYHPLGAYHTISDSRSHWGSVFAQYLYIVHPITIWSFFSFAFVAPPLPLECAINGLILRSFPHPQKIFRYTFLFTLRHLTLLTLGHHTHRIRPSTLVPFTRLVHYQA